MKSAAQLLAVLAVLTASHASAETRLLMFEQPGCTWCARWHAEIGPAYPRTAEGRTAPLERLQLGAALPADTVIDRPATFTPTFVLVEDGREVGRIEGYPGEDFFWPLLAELIARAEGTGG